tara:strand:- start:11659 stop:12672 length:1014 start_codon:yes stop_codon:yes gene_type:complete
MKQASKRHRATIFVAASLAVAGLVPAATLGYGTIRGMGQDAEHARITRHALACENGRTGDACFEPDTLDSLAGAEGSFGAVGAPDRGRGMLTSYAHCSAGDYFDVPDYPRSAGDAQASLMECRTEMLSNLDHAVLDAAALLDGNGDIRGSQIPSYIDCVYAGSEHGRAKCNILAHLGLILHASQDFYAHSNWVDQPDPGLPIGIENPPGLGHIGPSPWLDLRVANPAFPVGLISGCFDMESFINEEEGCFYGDEGQHRLRHFNLAKDTGPIDPVIGVGNLRRGTVGDNFRRSVEAAIEDSADKWATLRERLIATYGPVNGAMMICALTRDDPTDDCN